MNIVTSNCVENGVIILAVFHESIEAANSVFSEAFEPVKEIGGCCVSGIPFLALCRIPMRWGEVSTHADVV